MTFLLYFCTTGTLTKFQEKKARCGLSKDVACSFKRILRTVLDKTVVWPLSSHLIYHPIKTC